MENQTGMSIILCKPLRKYLHSLLLTNELVHEYKKNVDDYLEGLDFSEVRSLKELIEWNKEHADIEMPYRECLRCDNDAHANCNRTCKSGSAD